MFRLRGDALKFLCSIWSMTDIVIFENQRRKKFYLFFINDPVLFYSKSLWHIHKSEKTHCFFFEIYLSVEVCMSDVRLAVCLAVRCRARWVSIHSLCMHNQTGDSQTSTPLFSWDLLCSILYLSFFKLIDWGDSQSVEIDLFFGVKHISLLCIAVKSILLWRW